ncbi:hypothetical protein BX10_10300 [Escherichia coli O121:H7 str. 2009C-3299]|nr:hypothetical protein BX10_10300 [Escherichia coli O121:H7 str. 2009C-3299]
MQRCSSSNGNTDALSSTNSHMNRFLKSSALFSRLSCSMSNSVQPPFRASSMVTICRHWPSACVFS